MEAPPQQPPQQPQDAAALLPPKLLPGLVPKSNGEKSPRKATIVSIQKVSSDHARVGTESPAKRTKQTAVHKPPGGGDDDDYDGGGGGGNATNPGGPLLQYASGASVHNPGGGGYYFNRSRKYYNHNVFVLTSGARVRILVPTEPDRDDSLRYINYRSAISENTSRAYRIANSQSRSLGGAATGSAIFGEQSAGSMQNVVQLMVERQNLTSSSRVIDVGSGLGKPNFHFACDPGVALSYGVEVDPARVHISQCDLLSILRDDEMRFQQAAVNGTDAPNVEKNCILEFGDIFNAVTFDPFTHIYMYDIGMPDWLFEHMASTLTVRPDVLDGLGDGQEGKGCNHRAAQQGDRGVPEEKTRQAQETAGSARV